MSTTIHTPAWLKFFRLKCDFFALLQEQAELTHQGLFGLHEWLEHDAKNTCTIVHDSEHRADDVKRRIEENLRDTFVTPFDREEIYDLSERMDLILTGAKMMVKDMEYFADDEVDESLIDMGRVLADKSGAMVNSIQNLQKDVGRAHQEANHVRKALTQVHKRYRTAMKVAYQSKDSCLVIRKKQLYDYMLVTAERTEQVGEKLMHLCVKNG